MGREPARMRAITVDRYGPPEALRLEDVDRPVPGQGEVLVRVVAGSANPRDWHLIRGLPYVARPQMGLRKPKWRLPGSDVAGVVEELGGGVTEFIPGDEVFANVEWGGFSEYVCLAEGVLSRKPANLTFEEAAVVPLAALSALQGLRRGGVRAGQQVLIVGASGGVGHLAVQIARALGAHVTGVCSTGNVELVRSLGADEVVDYTREDFTAVGHRYDVILQLGGTVSARACRRALKRHGVLVLSSGEGGGRWFGPMGRLLSGMLLSPFVSQKIGPFTAKASAEDLDALRAMIEAGELRPVIERTYPLSQTVEAIRQVETAHVRGKLAISVRAQDEPAGRIVEGDLARR